MHKRFVLVSDYPHKIDRSLHCEYGPTHRWQDGFEIWHLNRVRVDKQIVMRPDTQTIVILYKYERENISAKTKTNN